MHLGRRSIRTLAAALAATIAVVGLTATARSAVVVSARRAGPLPAAANRTLGAASAPPALVVSAPRYSTSVSASTRFRFSWSAPGAPAGSVAAYKVQVKAGTNGLFSPLPAPGSATAASIRGLPGRTLYLRARAADASGAAGPWSPEAMTIVPFDDGAARYNGRWASKRGAALYGGNAKSAARRGASATIDFVMARSIALVVTMRPGGGTADVYIGSRRVKRVSTRSSRNRFRVVVPIRAYRTPTSGRLRIVAAGSGFQLDGFAIDTAIRPVFGIDSNLGSLDEAPRYKVLQMLRAAGCRWARIGVYWPWIDRDVTAGTTRTARDWSVSDRFVADAKANDQTIVGALLGYAAWANGQQNPEHPYFVPDDPSAFAAFAKEAVTRYKGDVHYWEVWNEPNGPFWTQPPTWTTKPNAAQYAKLLRATYLAIKSADPDAVVIYGGLSRNHLSYLKDSYMALKAYPDAAANHNFFDMLAVHPYCDSRSPTNTRGAVSPSLDRNFSGLPKMKALMAAQGDPDKHVIITEMSWSVRRIPGYTLAVSPATQAAYLVQAYRMVQSWPWCDALLWYGFKTWDDSDYESAFSLVNPDLSPRPAFGAYSAEANR